MIKISVVLINKNRGFSLKPAIEAVLRQLKADDELIVVDDNSSDDSVSILEDYLDEITKLIRISSGGNRSKVRNTGAKQAKNEIIIFVDGDVIIGPNNINKVRKLHENCDVIGTNGVVFGNDCDAQQFEIVTQMSVDEYAEKLNENFDVLYDYESFFDYRYFNDQYLQDTSKNWTHYFTSFASVKKEAFEQIGGFDENIRSWGSEDIEMAYRLNQYGKIIVDKSIVSFHWAHDKNPFDNFNSNTTNYYYFLYKYRTHQFEIAMAYDVSFPEPLRKWLREIMDTISRRNNNDYRPVLNNNEACIYLTDSKHKDGYIEIKKEDELLTLNLLGLALPVGDKLLDKIYISPYYGLLPESILATILQEAIRISKVVLLPRRKICSEDPMEDELQGRNFYMFNNLFAVIFKLKYFNFSEYDSEYFRVELKDNANMYVGKKNTIYTIC